ncbi:MAG: ABC transporter ATP-binding protein [bacterium]|nr:ABC transporter ATP-binding protein [bacterium]
MTIEHSLVAENIHVLTCETQRDVASIFLRFQEHYESPRFRGEIFSLEEFTLWYIQTSPGGMASGKFTYYTDWNGFNIPSYVLKPFYEGKFSPLSEQEEVLLHIFENEAEPFYIIGIHKALEHVDRLLVHEIAHGLFYTNKQYRGDVLRVLSQFDLEPLKEELRLKAGYHEEVLHDEIHAYSIDAQSNLETPIPKALSLELRKLYESYLNLTNAKF